jgi:hypothetical protein
MKRVGDATAGFSAVFDPDAGAVKVRGWGFWPPGVSSSFATSVSEVCSASPRGASLVVDMTDLKPLREEGQQSFCTLLRLLRGLGVGKTTVATSSHLTKLQLLRLVSEHGLRDAIQFTSGEGQAPNGLMANDAQGERTNR